MRLLIAALLGLLIGAGSVQAGEKMSFQVIASSKDASLLKTDEGEFWMLNHKTRELRKISLSQERYELFDQSIKGQ